MLNLGSVRIVQGQVIYEMMHHYYLSILIIDLSMSYALLENNVGYLPKMSE